METIPAPRLYVGEQLTAITTHRTEEQMLAILRRKANAILRFVASSLREQNAAEQFRQKVLVVSVLQAAQLTLDWIFDEIIPANSDYQHLLPWIERSTIWPTGGGTLGEAEMSMRRDCPISFAGRHVLLYDFLLHFGHTGAFLQQQKVDLVPFEERPANLAILYAIRNGKQVVRGTPDCYEGFSPDEQLDTPDYLFQCGLDYAKTADRHESVLRSGRTLLGAPKGCQRLRVNGLWIPLDH